MNFSYAESRVKEILAVAFLPHSCVVEVDNWRGALTVHVTVSGVLFSMRAHIATPLRYYMVLDAQIVYWRAEIEKTGALLDAWTTPRE